jgi:hypothetical protein
MTAALSAAARVLPDVLSRFKKFFKTRRLNGTRFRSGREAMPPASDRWNARLAKHAVRHRQGAVMVVVTRQRRSTRRMVALARLVPSPFAFVALAFFDDPFRTSGEHERHR